MVVVRVEADESILDGWYHFLWLGPLGMGLVGMLKMIRLAEMWVEVVLAIGLAFRRAPVGVSGAS